MGSIDPRSAGFAINNPSPKAPTLNLIPREYDRSTAISWRAIMAMAVLLVLTSGLRWRLRADPRPMSDAEVASPAPSAVAQHRLTVSDAGLISAGDEGTSMDS